MTVTQSNAPAGVGSTLSMVQLEQQIAHQLENYLPRYASFLRNPDSIPLDQYERMYVTDETVRAAVELIIVCVLATLGEYQHPKKRIESYVTESLHSMTVSLPKVCGAILSSIWAGFSVSEIVWEPDAGKIRPTRIVSLNPRSIRFKPDSDGNLTDPAVFQFGTAIFNQPYPGLPLPSEKLIVATHNKRFGNWYGESGLKPAYKNWLIKDHVLKSWARAQDRHGTPMLVGYAPNTMVDDPKNPGESISGVSLMARVLDQASDTNGIAVPLAETKDDPQVKVEAITQVRPGMSEGFQTFVAYLNKSIFRAMLLPSLLIEEGQSGSYALADTHLTLFEWTNSGVRDELVEALIFGLVRKIVEYNFGPQATYGTFGFRQVRLSEKSILSAVVKDLTLMGYSSPATKADYDYVRESFGWPEDTGGAVLPVVVGPQVAGPDSTPTPSIQSPQDKVTRTPTGGRV